jgi:putative ABC transport system permease protein
MWLMKLAWKNLWRSRSRTLVTVSSIFFAVVLSVVTSSLQDGVFDNFIRNLVSFYSGYIQVHQRGYWDQQILDNGFIRNASLEHAVTRTDNVAAVAPRLESYALASAGDLTKGCLVVGIAPQLEDRITFLRSKVTQGEYFAANESQNVALVAEGLASRLKVHLHDTLILISQGYHGAMAAGRYIIQGMVQFGSPQLNDQLLYLPLPVAQQFLGADSLLTSYVLALESDNRLNTTAQHLTTVAGDRYEVMTWEEMLPEVKQHIQTDRGSMYIISGILYLLISFGIFGTLLMMIAERRYEMGMLLAIGMKKRKLMWVVLMESVLSVSLGCLAGILLSIPIVQYLKIHPLRFGGEMADIYRRFGFEPVFPASTDASIFITQGLIVLALGLLLSFYPLIRIAGMDPVTAMKR